MSASILTKLKSHTRHLHDEIEQTVTILDQRSTVADYGSYLARLLGFHAPVERVLAAQALRAATAVTAVTAVTGPVTALATNGDLDLGSMLQLDRRWKAPLLVQDLQALGMSPSAVHALPMCKDLPDLSAPGLILGCLYVLEGATLGGQIIRRQLMQRFPEELARASAYLNCYGDDTGSMWRALQEVLMRHAGDAACEAQMLSAACETFHTLRVWLASAPACGTRARTSPRKPGQARKGLEREVAHGRH